MKTEKFDLMILGGGPAGMTAALYAARAGLKTLVLDQNTCGGLMNWTRIVENMPSYNEIGGMALSEKMQEQIEALDVVIEEVAEIEKVELSEMVKEIETDEIRYQAPAVILCTGRKPIELDLDEPCDNVHYCAICDGAWYKNKKVIVVGGGNSGFDEAISLLDQGIEKVTLVEMMDQFFAAKKAQDEFQSRTNAECFKNTVIQSIDQESGKLTHVTLFDTASEKTRTVDCDGIFVFMGQSPNTSMFKGILDMDDNGYLTTNELMETSIAGVYAAGDVRVKKYRQITTAMSDGTIAALEAERYIRRMS